LILGMFTTLALLARLLLNFNYMFAGSVSVNPIYIIEALILLWAGWAAYYWSLDRLTWNKCHKKNFPDKYC